MFFLFFISSVMAQCGRYEFKGIPRIKESQLYILLYEKTKSETIIRMPASEEIKFAPYIDRMVKGSFQMISKDGVTDVKGQGFVELNYDLPDPLRPDKHNYLRLIKNEKCL